MLHPTTYEILSEGDEYDRAVQREAFQLQNELTMAGIRCPSLFVQGVNALGAILVTTGTQLKSWQVTADSRVPGKVRG